MKKIKDNLRNELDQILNNTNDEEIVKAVDNIKKMLEL